MPIYRVHVKDAHEESQGYYYCTNKKDINRALSAIGADDPDYGPSRISGVDALPVPRNKKELVELLNQCASHPDNG